MTSFTDQECIEIIRGVLEDIIEKDDLGNDAYLSKLRREDAQNKLKRVLVSFIKYMK